MTLTRLVLAWLPVAVEFAFVAGLGGPPPPGRRPWMPTRAEAAWRAGEAGLVTLFASLWFDSLGHGGWWLLFALVGALMGLPSVRAQPPAWRAFALDVARYVGAGAILAWTLG